MKFNALKSDVIFFRGKPNKSAPKYYLNGKLLTSIQSVKYLGGYLTHDMKWCSYIDYIANKAWRVLSLIKHLLYDVPEKVKPIAYVTLCRPLLEQVCEIWDLTTQTLITNLKDIHSKAKALLKFLEADMFLYQAQKSYQALIHFRTLEETKELHFCTMFWSMSLSFLTC